MNLTGVQSEMQEDRCWSLWPVQGIDTVLTNSYESRANDNTLSLLYCDLYLRQYKESLKQTMLHQESVFEDQIHELHRLYQRQKEMMMEMEGNNNFSSPRTSNHWMSSSVSISEVSLVPPEEASAKIIDEAGFSGYENDILEEEEEGLKDGKVHEVTNFPNDQSPRRMSPESVVQMENVQQLTDLQRFKFTLDLNEPAMVEEHSDYELDQFLTSAKTRSERAEPEAEDLLICTKRHAENGIDLNMSPLSSGEKESIFKTKESEQPREFVSVSSRGKQGSGPSRVLVQALPCSKTILFFDQKRYRPPRRSSSSKKKLETGSVGSLREVKPDKYCTNAGKRRRYKPHRESGKVMKKIARRTKSKTRWRFLDAEEEEQEISAAAEAIVDMSLSGSARKSSIKTSDCFTPLDWFAKFATSVAEDSKSEVGSSGIHSDHLLDYFEAVTLQLTEMTRKEQRTGTLISNFVTPKQKRTPRSQSKRQQQQNKTCHIEHLPSLSIFTENEASQDLDKIEKLIEASETNGAHHSLMKNICIDWGTVTKRRRGIRSPATKTKKF